MKQLNWYQIFGKSNIPDGRTVLPTDDIQIWLHCANIWDKTYTTLAEVLADTDTLLALISSNNAVDYMVRSTTWAESIALVPKMTSNTTPSGVCFGYNTYPSLQPYYSFNQDYSNNWASRMDAYGYVGYIFDTPKAIGQISMDSYYLYACVIEGSNDTTTGLDGTWEQIGGELSITTYGYDSDVHSDKAVFNGNSYKAYRLYITSGKGGSASRGAIRILQFHTPSIVNNANAMTYIGQNNYASNTLLDDATWREAICNSTYKTSVLNVTNPNMTDNTHPYGECFASSIYSSDYAEWKAFTGSINIRGWNCNSSEYNKLDQAYIGYEFTSAVKVCMIEFIYNTNSTAVSSSEIRVVANDNSADAWNVMSDVYTGTGTGQTERKIILNSYTPYKRIALKGSFYQGQRYFQICKATIYGRKDI